MKRIEFKVDIDKTKKITFLNFLKNNKANTLYEKRLINSIYFDNKNFEMYFDSVEGLSPRKKIRLRYYGKEKKNLDDVKILLEHKYTNYSGRSKNSIYIDNHIRLFKNGILDSKYGICYPKTLVSYLRSYYSIKDFRFTLDENIRFKVYNDNITSCNQSSIDEIIVEIKTNNIEKIDEMKKKFPFSEIRFSKYCKSIEKLFNI